MTLHIDSLNAILGLPDLTQIDVIVSFEAGTAVYRLESDAEARVTEKLEWQASHNVGVKLVVAPTVKAACAFFGIALPAAPTGTPDVEGSAITPDDKVGLSEQIDNTFRDDGNPMRRFYLRRLKDETGVSRTGRVLEGVLTQSGKVLTEWRPPHSTMGVYNSLAEFMLIHVDCHPSCNEVVWLDGKTED